ncbi:Nucleolar protein,Nop52 containing protein [Musa troglodytarum]|uniref:Nucleolar protein,Nop52 containing protein n=1 Tax=Musa troglodytarum TaxID=320322 RepID=A0A9E7GLH1_9LILI|nr:Nucleolar protein,Nop52 containing protein [Musa troglodytarum]
MDGPLSGAVETLDLMLKPFVSVLEKSADKVLLNKIKLNVFCRLLDNGRKMSNLEKNGVQVDLGSEVVKLGRVSLLLNDLEKSGVHILTEMLENGSSENVISPVVSESAEQVEVNNGCADGLSRIKHIKKRKKLKEASDGIKKKKSGEKKLSLDSATEGGVLENTSEPSNVVNDASLNGDVVENQEMDFDECVISDLQRQFEKAAAEAGISNNSYQLSALPATLVTNPAPKKRKRVKTAEAKVRDNGTVLTGKALLARALRIVLRRTTRSLQQPDSPRKPAQDLAGQLEVCSNQICPGNHPADSFCYGL